MSKSWKIKVWKNYQMLDETKDTWQLNKMWDLEAYPGIETKGNKKKTGGIWIRAVLKRY